MTHNRYPGINPHLNSALQQKDWKGFHNLHLAHLLESIIPLLPKGYYARLEDSLQLSARNFTVGTGADIVIRSRGRQDAATSPAQMQLSEPTLLMEVFESEEFVPAVVIYAGDTPVTRIELLSPANKRSGSHHPEYLARREATLRAGLRLVEIDYLHASRPVLARLPSYPDEHPGATLYMIIVADPRKVLDGMAVFGFGILDKLPIIEIPLDNTDVFVLDFGPVYQRTFNTNPFYYEILV